MVTTAFSLRSQCVDADCKIPDEIDIMKREIILPSKKRADEVSGYRGIIRISDQIETSECA
jgi:hypothetical protein